MKRLRRLKNESTNERPHYNPTLQIRTIRIEVKLSPFEFQKQFSSLSPFKTKDYPSISRPIPFLVYGFLKERV